MPPSLLNSFCILLTLLVLGTAHASGHAGEHIATDLPCIQSNGLFSRTTSRADAMVSSQDDSFWARYEIDRVGDEVRELSDFRLFRQNDLQCTIQSVPGSDAYVSNTGLIAFMDHRKHYLGQLTIHFYSEEGEPLFSRTFKRAALFGFTPRGTRFGVGTPQEFELISPESGDIETYPTAVRFDVSHDGNHIVLANEDELRIFSHGALKYEFLACSPFCRKVRVSAKDDLVAVIYKNALQAYSLSTGELLFSRKADGGQAYRDLIVQDGYVAVGIQHRMESRTQGLARIYSRQGELLEARAGTARKLPQRRTQDTSAETFSKYEPIPWPFAPFDSVHTVWNYYEQHMGGYGSDWSYLHQGLDIITPVGEPTYAVQRGIVKCVLTLGGAIYWRVAVSKEQTAEPSEGWLYAHLIEESIQVDVGDTVEVHDYLGDIIHWADDWGHIHFVKIRDSGLEWQYQDDEWGILFNPLLSLTPDTDLIPPVIDPVFETSKFAFCENETSNYLAPDSLYGDIDIIIKVRDYVGDSPWVQPAYRIYYWVNEMETGDIVFRRTLGQILNHSYDFYACEHYEPFATLLYKRDDLLVPSSWMSMDRNFYHIITNNNGDSLAVLEEKALAFVTSDYSDGCYRLFVEVFDEYGNSVQDSMDVQFRNGVGGITDKPRPSTLALQLEGSSPNPFSSETKLAYSIPAKDWVTVRLYDMQGNRVLTLVNEMKRPGLYSTTVGSRALPAGTYICTLRQRDLTDSRRLVILR